MKIIPLSEGAFTIDTTKQFIPFNLLTDNLQSRKGGSLLVEIQPFLVITSRDVLLLDTGLGFLNEEGVLQLHVSLAANGINASDVTKVLLTHLHKDHAGGISFHTNQLSRSVSFENATYFINGAEFDFALLKSSPSYKVENFQILANSDKVSFTSNNGMIDDYIKYEVTGGHSPYHQVFWITENNETIFFGGDVAPQLQQMKRRFMAKYDYDGRKSMELREQWWNLGEKEGWTFLFYHDLQNPVFKFPSIKKIGLP